MTRLTIRFAGLDDFRREFHRNIANGGIFVPTTESLELRQAVDVALDLAFRDEIILMQGEVVSCIGRDLARTEDRMGVAVQFWSPADEVRSRLGELAGLGALSHPTPALPDGLARRDERTPSNLPRTGALLALDGPPLPVGERITVVLSDPQTGDDCPVAARIVRYAAEERDCAAVGVTFEQEPDTSADTQRFIDTIRANEHARRVGAITGPLATLDFATLLQMFSSAADAGTISVRQGSEEGLVVFVSGTLRYASVGPVAGLKALSRMMAWRDGVFEFYSDVDPKRAEGEPITMYGAVLEAVQYVDEIARLDLSALPLELRLVSTVRPGEAHERDKLEQRLLAKMSRPLPVEAIVNSAPEYDALVYRALIALLADDLIEPASESSG